MIQRIQTLFYLLAGGAFGGLFNFPFASSTSTGTHFMSDQVYNVFDNPVLMVMAGLGIGLALLAIFLFKNRTMQIKLGYILIILSIFIPLVAMALFYTEASQIMNTGEINDQVGIYLPVLSLVFAILANRFVGKDEKTVRSMDRLR